MSNVYLYMYNVHLQMFYTGQVLLWAVCYIGRVLLWGGHGLGQHYKQQPGKELARGQFARQGACVGEGEGGPPKAKSRPSHAFMTDATVCKMNAFTGLVNML